MLLFVSIFGVEYFELVETTDKAIDKERFQQFIERSNYIRASSIVYQLDNASIHNFEIERTIRQSPYSPDLNPVEKVFGLIKARLRQHEYSLSTLKSIILQVVSSISADDVRPHFLHCQRLWKDNEYSDRD